MKTRATVVMTLAMILSGAGAFLVARMGAEAASTPGPTLATAVSGCQTKDAFADWLGLSAEQRKQVAQADPDCESDVHALKAQLGSKRQALADLLLKPASGEAEVLQQVQAVAQVHDQLECRVVRHIFLMRPSLSDEQARKLMTLAAGEVLKPHGWQGISPCCLGDTCGCMSHRADVGDHGTKE